MSYWIDGTAIMGDERRGLSVLLPRNTATEQECRDHFVDHCLERGYKEPVMTHWGNT